MRKVIVLLFFLLIPLNVEATIKYRWYQEEKIYSENYYIEGENDINFPYKSDISIEQLSLSKKILFIGLMHKKTCTFFAKLYCSYKKVNR